MKGKKMLNAKKLNQYIQMIDDAFYFDRWGHYVTPLGLLKIFQPDSKLYFFRALKIKNIESHSTAVNGTFAPFGGRFYFCPLFREKYWAKIVEIKKQVPIIAKKTRGGLRNGSQLCHAYQLLINAPLIPSYDQVRDYPQLFAEYKHKILSPEEAKLRLKSKKN